MDCHMTCVFLAFPLEWPIPDRCLLSPWSSQQPEGSKGKDTVLYPQLWCA